MGKFPSACCHAGNFPAAEMLIFQYLTHAALKFTKTPIVAHSDPISFGM